MIDEKIFNNAVSVFSDGLFRFMLRLTNDTDQAKNYVQDAFMILWENKAAVDEPQLKSFLFTTAYRKMIDDHRKNVVRQNYATQVQYASQHENNIASNFENKQMLEQVLSHLNTEQKTIILLRDYEGYDYESIAKITKSSLAQVKINLFRARKIIKELNHKIV